MDQRYRVEISPEAAVDLSSIRAYVSEDSPDNADKLIAHILTAIESLADVPHRTVFQASRARRPAVRVLPVKPYVVYFRAFDEEQMVRVLTIRHGARRRPRRFP